MRAVVEKGAAAPAAAVAVVVNGVGSFIAALLERSSRRAQPADDRSFCAPGISGANWAVLNGLKEL